RGRHGAHRRRAQRSRGPALAGTRRLRPMRGFSGFFLAALLFAAALSPASAAQTVRAQYNLSMNDMPVGVMQETFETRDGAYQAVSETRATGVFALVQRRPGRVTSSGKVDAAGLRPETFDGARGVRDE